MSADVSKQIEDADLTDKEKEEVEALEAAMDDELSKAKSEEEKQNILKKYNDKISTATGGKVTVPTNRQSHPVIQIKALPAVKSQVRIIRTARTNLQEGGQRRQ